MDAAGKMVAEARPLSVQFARIEGELHYRIVRGAKPVPTSWSKVPNPSTREPSVLVPIKDGYGAMLEFGHVEDRKAMRFRVREKVSNWFEFRSSKHYPTTEAPTCLHVPWIA